MQRRTSITTDDLKLFKDCPRCFYLSYKFDIKRPSKSNKKNDPTDAPEDSAKEIKKVVSKGVPLSSPKCIFCIYRQLVKETGIENEIAA